VTKVAALRIITQLLRTKKEISDQFSDMILAHSMTITILNNNALNSKDGIIQACCIQILGLLQKYLMMQKRDISPLKLDISKVVELFEKNV
jgi:hypothetical protein